jgi:hypothetical protein
MDWRKGEVSMEISNDQGQVVYAQRLPMYSGFQQVDVSGLAAGSYLVQLTRAQQIIATNMFIKQ